MVRALPEKTTSMKPVRKYPGVPVPQNLSAAPPACMSDTFKASLKVANRHCRLDSQLFRIHFLTAWRIHLTPLSSGLRKGDFSLCRLSAELRRKKVRVSFWGSVILGWSITAFLRRLRYSSPCQNIAQWLAGV